MFGTVHDDVQALRALNKSISSIVEHGILESVAALVSCVFQEAQI